MGMARLCGEMKERSTVRFGSGRGHRQCGAQFFGYWLEGRDNQTCGGVTGGNLQLLQAESSHRHNRVVVEMSIDGSGWKKRKRLLKGNEMCASCAMVVLRN
ncbi:prepilin-type cleavage/methylation domain-containing [Sesbania bispinosa]|nr:prepilin-type cleavage/methylation domain-containing [Sesbania bispinosa]